MANSLPQGSCCSCQDSSLSIAANVIGILTFIYAVVVGLNIYAQLIKRSREDFEETSTALGTSLHRILDLADACQESLLHSPEPRREFRILELRDIMHQADVMIEERWYWRPKNIVSDRIKRWAGRVQFAMTGVELKKKFDVKDKIMDGLKRIQDECVLRTQP